MIRFAAGDGGGGVMGVCGPLRLELKQAWYHHAALLCTVMASFDPDGVPIPCPMCRR